MRHEQDRFLEPRLQFQQFVLKLLADQRVERAEGLVEKPDFGIDGKRTGDADALLLSARQFRRVGAAAAVKPDKIEHFIRLGCALFCRLAAHLQRKGDVLKCCKMRDKTEILEHHSHPVPPDIHQPRFRHGGEVRVVEPDFAG